MTANISPIVLTNTFEYVINRVNDLIEFANTYVISANSTTAGNSAITGTFTANTLVSNTANISNFNTFGITSNTTNLTISANTISTTTANISNLIINDSVTSSFSVNTTGTSVQEIDTFSIETYGSAEYILDVKDNIANNQSHSRLSILNSGTPFSSEYAMLFSNNFIGQFTVTSNSTMIILNYQPSTSANTTIKGTKTLLTK
jgi:hypothetical protein